MRHRTPRRWNEPN